LLSIWIKPVSNDRERLEHYLDPEDYNKVIYHSRNEDVDERMSVLLADADELIKLCDGQCEDATEYLLFSRCMSEQTIVDGGLRRLRNKEDGGMDSNMMQPLNLISSIIFPG
jgi:hypothetical protein